MEKRCTIIRLQEPTLTSSYLKFDSHFLSISSHQRIQIGHPFPYLTKCVNFPLTQRLFAGWLQSFNSQKAARLSRKSLHRLQPAIYASPIENHSWVWFKKDRQAQSSFLLYSSRTSQFISRLPWNFWVSLLTTKSLAIPHQDTRRHRQWQA